MRMKKFSKLLLAAAFVLQSFGVSANSFEDRLNSSGIELLQKSVSRVDTDLSAEQMWQLIRANQAVSFGISDKQAQIRRSGRALLLSIRNAAGEVVDARRIVIPENATPREIADYLNVTVRSINVALLDSNSLRSIASEDGILSPRSDRRINMLVGILGVLAAFSSFDYFEKGKMKEAVAVIIAAGAIISADYFVFN